MFVKDITIGDTFQGEVFLLEKLNKEGDEGFLAVLSDKTGKMDALISRERFEERYMSFVGGAVKVNAIVLNGTDGKVLVKIRTMEIAGRSEYKPSDLFDALSEKKKEEYTALLKDALGRIPDAGCRALCEAVLTDEVLSLLGEYPASVSYQASFKGGALAQTATVTRMVLQMGLSYQRQTNGLYGCTLEWSILLSGALLHMVGVLDYFTDQPWRRTPVGIDRGYFSLLQSRIEAARVKSAVPLNDIKFARLINVLQVSQYRTVLKASTHEGILLRQAVLCFAELDQLDAAVAASDKMQFFDAKSRRHINTAPLEADDGKEHAA